MNTEFSLITFYIVVLAYSIFAFWLGLKTTREARKIIHEQKTPVGEKWWHNHEGKKAAKIGRDRVGLGLAILATGILAFAAVMSKVLEILTN